MNSIHSRLLTGLLISLLFFFSVLWVTVSQNIQELAENYIATRLEHDIENILTAVSFDENTQLILDEKYINPIYQRPFSGHYFKIIHDQKIIRSRSLWDQDLAVTTTDKTPSLRSHLSGPENQSLLSVSANYTKQKQNFSIAIAEDLSPVIKDINYFKNIFTATALLILVILLAIQFFILKRGMQPLRKLQHELKALEKGNIEQLNTEVPHELQAVVKEINHLSLALHKRLKRSRTALSDLSHALKKPLTLLQNFIENDQHNVEKSSTEYLQQQVQTIQQLTDRILKQARIAGTTTHPTLLVINDDVHALIKTIASMYPDKHLNIELNIPENFTIQFDREDFLEMLGNLLDNAWKWAKTSIAINFDNTNTTFISIEDDGPGTNTDELNTLIERGSRLDESVDGYGFGLAISSDIIKDNNGTLTFCRSEGLGGLKVTIKLGRN